MISREFCCASSPAAHVFWPLKASERLTRPLKLFSQQYLINIDLLPYLLFILFSSVSALSSVLGMNWEWMSTSNLTWPLLMGSLSLGIRATPSQDMGVATCPRVIRLSMHLITGRALPTNKVHRKVREWKYKMIVTGKGNVFNMSLSSVCKIFFRVQAKSDFSLPASSFYISFPDFTFHSHFSLLSLFLVLQDMLLMQAFPLRLSQQT